MANKLTVHNSFSGMSVSGTDYSENDYSVAKMGRSSLAFPHCYADDGIYDAIATKSLRRSKYAAGDTLAVFPECSVTKYIDDLGYTLGNESATSFIDTDVEHILKITNLENGNPLFTPSDVNSESFYITIYSQLSINNSLGSWWSEPFNNHATMGYGFSIPIDATVDYWLVHITGHRGYSYGVDTLDVWSDVDFVQVDCYYTVIENGNPVQYYQTRTTTTSPLNVLDASYAEGHCYTPYYDNAPSLVSVNLYVTSVGISSIRNGTASDVPQTTDGEVIATLSNFDPWLTYADLNSANFGFQIRAVVTTTWGSANHVMSTYSDAGTMQDFGFEMPDDAYIYWNEVTCIVKCHYSIANNWDFTVLLDYIQAQTEYSVWEYGRCALDVGGFIGSVFAPDPEADPPESPISVTINACCVDGDVDGEYMIGGFIGNEDADTDVKITDCYATGFVTGESNNDMIGGFVGSATGEFTNVYSVGLVTNEGDGGVGGLCGVNDGGSATHCYWDTEASEASTSALGTGKTTAEMKTKATFIGWDFATIWFIGSSYPTLIDKCSASVKSFSWVGKFQLCHVTS